VFSTSFDRCKFITPSDHLCLQHCDGGSQCPAVRLRQLRLVAQTYADNLTRTFRKIWHILTKSVAKLGTFPPKDKMRWAVPTTACPISAVTACYTVPSSLYKPANHRSADIKDGRPTANMTPPPTQLAFTPSCRRSSDPVKRQQQLTSHNALSLTTHQRTLTE